MLFRLPALACALLLLLPVPAMAGAKETVAALAPSGTGARDGRRGQRAGRPERRQALRPGLRHQDRDRLAGDGGPGRRLPLRDQILPGQGPGAVCARRRRSLPDLRGAGAARRAAGRRDRQGADHRHRARCELLPRRPPHPGHRGHQRGLRRAELRAGGELQHDLRRAQRQYGPLRREADADHPAGDQPVPGARAPRAAAASASPKTPR